MYPIGTGRIASKTSRYGPFRAMLLTNACYNPGITLGTSWYVDPLFMFNNHNVVASFQVLDTLFGQVMICTRHFRYSHRKWVHIRNIQATG